MRKILVIAVREYQAAVRTKMFLVSLVLMPVLCGGAILANVLLEGQIDTTDRKVAVIDRTGALFAALAEEADKHNQAVVNPATGKKEQPRFLFDAVEPDDADPVGQQLGLSDRVRAEEYFAFIDIDSNAIAGAEEEEVRPRIAYYSNNPTYDDIERFIRGPLNNTIQSIRLKGAGIDKAVVDEATAWVPVENLGLVSRDESGQIKDAERTNKVAGIIVPMIFMFLMFMVVMIGATPLMQGVLEEKMQRIAEVLLGSVTPFQLMAGKLVGMVGVSLTIVVLYMGCGVATAAWAGYADLVPHHLVVWFVVYQVMAVLMFGSMFSAVGAACSDLKEAQSAFMPVWLVVCVPLFIWFHVAREPTSTFSTVVSLFPPATPMLMLVRQAVPPGPPLWQPLLGIALTLVTTVLCVFASGRIFRVGLLMQGKGANFRQLVRWAISG